MATDILTRWIATRPDQAWQDRTTEATSNDETPNLRLSGERFQQWEGFGGCFNELGWVALSTLDEDGRRLVLRELFDQQEGCRFNLCRLPIGASDYAAEWYSHNEHDGDFAMEHFSIERDRHYLIPYIQMAMEFMPDVKLFASPWSPPTWLKFPKAYNYGTIVRHAFCRPWRTHHQR